jgi:hypothetical protein
MPEDNCCRAVESLAPEEVKLFWATSELRLVLRTSDMFHGLLSFRSAEGHQSVVLSSEEVIVHAAVEL